MGVNVNININICINIDIKISINIIVNININRIEETVKVELFKTQIWTYSSQDRNSCMGYISSPDGHYYYQLLLDWRWCSHYQMY